MASSASGIACLTKALSNLYQINHLPEDAIQLNNITRMASGSACRSLYGGLVKWDRGDDHTPSIAHQVFFFLFILFRFMMLPFGVKSGLLFVLSQIK